MFFTRSSRPVAQAAAALGLVLTLSACSGGGSDQAAATTSQATTTAVTTTPETPVTPASVTAVTTLDFASVANYADPALPAYYDQTVAALDNTPNGETIDNKVATLGRVLFYDRRLSVNDSKACASCHIQANGFDDTTRFSTGFSGQAFTTAHAMRLGNVRYYRPGTMFWDKRAATLEAQASQPIINPIEMGFTPEAGGIPALLAKLQATADYPDLFTFAFGGGAITEARIQQALAQFERAMISSSSRWDTAYAQVFAAQAPDRNLGVTLPGFSLQEDRGRQLFMTALNVGGAGCSACHQPPTFALAANSRSNGLDAGETIVFKAPSLKNVAQSVAFMHDGRFATLEAVIEHYNGGVRAGPALDNRLQGPNGAPIQLNLSTADKAALVAFLRTLTDPTLASDPKFSNPFRN